MDRVRNSAEGLNVTKTWILGLAALLGAAALIVAAVVPAAEAALWPGLIVMCGVTGLALTRRSQAAQREKTETAAPPADEVAADIPRHDKSREEMLSALLERSPSGAYAADGDGRLIYVNQTLARTLGKSSSALM